MKFSSCGELWCLWKLKLNQWSSTSRNLFLKKEKGKLQIFLKTSLICLIFRWILSFREEGVIFAITLWQWCIEAFFNLTILVFQYFFKEMNRMIDHTFLLMGIVMSTVVLPSFYFMSGRAFRRVLKTEGFFKTMWKAYTHDLNWMMNEDWRMKAEEWRMRLKIEYWVNSALHEIFVSGI